MDKAGSETNVLWVGGKVERVSDSTWLMSWARTKFYKEGEATEVYCNEVTEANYPPGRTIETFDQKLWNKDKVGAWRRYHGEVEYGIQWIVYNLEPSNGLCVLTIHIGASYMEQLITTRHYYISLTKSANYGKSGLEMKKRQVVV